MDAPPTLDFAFSIRYALTPRPAPDGRVEIVLDLFRGSAPALTRTVASVRDAEAAPILATCRRHLDRLGAHAVSRAAASAAEPAQAWAAPLAAFDWMFAG